MDDVVISIVSPEYKGVKMVADLVARIKQSVSAITEQYEVILVNDGSPDNTWEEIVKEAAMDKRVKGINLSRNFGQQYAITAGLKYAKGRWIVVMDCDLQNPPEEIPRLYDEAIAGGWDIVYASRKEEPVKRLSSLLFHKVFNWLSDRKTTEETAEFGLYSSRVIAEYIKMPETGRGFEYLIQYLGFESTSIPCSHDERLEGHSSYSFKKLLKLSSDIIFSNSNKPLKIAAYLGLLMSFSSFLFAVWCVIAYYLGIYSDVTGFTSLILSVWFVGGVILLVMGILGIYIGRIFDQVKCRPLFVVKDTVNIETV